VDAPRHLIIIKIKIVITQIILFLILILLIIIKIKIIITQIILFVILILFRGVHGSVRFRLKKPTEPNFCIFDKY
jgi:hypothetical protein